MTEKVIIGSQPATSASTRPADNDNIMELTSSPDGMKTNSGATTLPMSVSGEVQANEEDKYGVWSSSQRALLQVAIISLTILCAVCFTVCATMIALFLVACCKRNAPPQGYYKKVLLTEKDQDMKLSETMQRTREGVITSPVTIYFSVVIR